MTASALLIVLLGVALFAYFVGVRRSQLLVKGDSVLMRQMHSLPSHHGAMMAVWSTIPALVAVLLWSALQDRVVISMVAASLPEQFKSLPVAQVELLVNEIRNLAAGVSGQQVEPALQVAANSLNRWNNRGRLAMSVVAFSLAGSGAFLASRRIRVELRARNEVESLFKVVLGLCSTVALFTTLGVVLSVLWEALRFFEHVSVFDFLFGLKWSPQTAIRADQVGGSGSFGAVPLFAGTFLISAIALSVGAPVGLFSAIYLAEYATTAQRGIAKPALEMLAGIPTVVYGFFAALTVAPFLRGIGAGVGLNVSSESALAAGLVMGVMLVPFVSSLADDVISAVPQALRDASYGLGASRSETIALVVLPAALPGIVGALLLAVSRAVGETMIVVMAAGLAANLTGNPFEAVTTVTVQIVTLLVGDQEFDSPKTLAAFALGLTLFLFTLVLNVYALHVVRKYRELYD